MKGVILFLLCCMFELIANKVYTQEIDSIGKDCRKSVDTVERVIPYPQDWKTKMGTDGRVIAYPQDWKTEMGTDGRVIAYPQDWKTKMGTDGRIIAHPQVLETDEGKDDILLPVSLITFYYLVNSNQVPGNIKP